MIGAVESASATSTASPASAIPLRRRRAWRVDFYDALEARADPEHDEHETAITWLDDYDPDTFDVLPIKYTLGRIAARRNAARSPHPKVKDLSPRSSPAPRRLTV